MVSMSDIMTRFLSRRRWGAYPIVGLWLEKSCTLPPPLFQKYCTVPPDGRDEVEEDDMPTKVLGSTSRSTTFFV
jgi:hypothetical protein